MPEVLEDIILSEDLKRVLSIAQSIARENMHAAFAPAHLLKALLHKDAGLQNMLEKLDKDIYYLEEWADVRLESEMKSPAPVSNISSDPAAREVLNEADNIRLRLSAEAIEPIHVLAAISTPGVGFSFDQLKAFPLRREELMNTVTAGSELTASLGTNGKKLNGVNKPAAGSNALLKYCIDKSLLAREGKIDNIVGRDKEIRMMAEILCRRSKPNVLITGEPGVGKSALVDGFAMAIMKEQVPSLLFGARIYELDTGSLVAGASYKGEIEDRLKSIIAEIKQFDKAILFIDEIHTMLDKNGSAAGAVNLLKPELARGEIILIGATTQDEYRKYIQADEAFNRRFELLTVEEPGSEMCFRMMKAVIPFFEQHHAITVPDETIRETIRLSKRYIKERRLPDAALDLADRSMAALRMISDTGARDLQAFRAQFDEWNLATPDVDANLRSLEDWHWLHTQMKDKISPLLWAHFQSEENPSQMTGAEEVRAYLQQALDALGPAAATPHTELDKSDVAAIVSYKTGIPIGKVQTQEKERLLNMESVLKQRVVGQDHAIKTIAEAVLEARSGLNKQGQPIGSFFFLGPTGTGKTELAKALAEFLFQDESFMIRFDMSEFKESHAAALLYGAPPGYVGYQEGGLLVNKIRQKPYSVVLFDEIEKAHASVFDIFLQIMDEGKLHDKLGKEGDFSNAVIIFTSNIGSGYVADSFTRGEIPASNKLMEIMATHFRPEFLGRLTEIVPFASITPGMVQDILKIHLKGLFQTLDKKGIQMAISDKAAEILASMGFTPQYGARPLSGVVRTQLRRPLSRMIISGEIQSGSHIELDADDNDNLLWKKGS